MIKKISYAQILSKRAADQRRSFDQLISKLVANYEITDREGLEETINEAAKVYAGDDWVRAEEGEGWPNTLWKLAKPLDRVIRLLYQSGNQHEVLQALGADETVEKIDRALDRREELLRDLGRIRHAIPSPPKKRSKGRPSTTTDLQELVGRLATYWERATRRRFTQAWLVTDKLVPASKGSTATRVPTSKGSTAKRLPASKSSTAKRVPASKGSTAFVYDVVEFLDRKRLRSLPKVTEKIVAERRAATSRK